MRQNQIYNVTLNAGLIKMLYSMIIILLSISHAYAESPNNQPPSGEKAYYGDQMENAFLTNDERLQKYKNEIENKNKKNQISETSKNENINIDKLPQVIGGANLSTPCNENRAGNPSINNGTKIDCMQERSNKNRATVDFGWVEELKKNSNTDKRKNEADEKYRRLLELREKNRKRNNE